MKILIVSPFFYPHIGGSQRYMEELAVHLMRQHSDIRVDVLCYNTDSAERFEVYRGLRIHRIACRQIIPGQFAVPNPFALFAILHELAKRNYDVVYANTRFFDTTWWAWAFARIMGAKSIVTDHVAMHPKHQSKIVQTISTLVDLTIARWAILQHDMITVTNSATKHFLDHELNIKRDIRLEYGGVDTRFFSPRSKGKRTIPMIKQSFGRKDILITFAGRMIWSKGVNYLFEAAKKLIHNRSSHVYVVFAGDGEQERILREKTRRSGIDHHVFFTGRLNARQVRDTLRATDIFVYPSHHAEGFPNAILEAGACKCFVVATDNAGVDEIITNRSTGLLIAKKSTASIINAIRWALAHPHARRSMATKLRSHVQNRFDWKPVSDHFYVSVIRSLPLATRELMGLRNYLKATA